MGNLPLGLIIGLEVENGGSLGGETCSLCEGMIVEILDLRKLAVGHIEFASSELRMKVRVGVGDEFVLVPVLVLVGTLVEGSGMPVLVG